MKSKDKEAEAVNEALRENGAQQTRPMRAEVVRRRWDAAAWAKPGPQRGGASKAVGVAGGDAGCGAVGGEPTEGRQPSKKIST
jgi:hypothetical protein